MIKRPPLLVDLPEYLGGLPETHDYWEDQGRYASIAQAWDSSGRYLPYDKLRFRMPKGLDKDLCWQLIRGHRKKLHAPIIPVKALSPQCYWVRTPAVDALLTQLENIREAATDAALPGDFVSEAIASSQLEGASTPTKVAFEMLKSGRAPNTPCEAMIAGNYQLMMGVWAARNQSLSVELIRDLHAICTQGIADDDYSPGEFRSGVTVTVQDGDGNVVHQPPAAEGIVARLNALCAWINDSDDIHDPVIKAISLHFAMGYEHPFRDGNGRMARALFYWMMFKHGYSRLVSVSITAIIQKAPQQYGLAYVFTETDGNDLTYFIDYQASVLGRAISAVRQ